MSEETNQGSLIDNITFEEPNNEKYQAIVEWLKSYEPLNKHIYFNVIRDQAKTASVNSVSNGSYISEYIDDTREVEFLFAISLQESFDTGTSNANLKGIAEYYNLTKWIEEKNKERSYPTFADDELIEKLEVMQTAPTVTVDANNKVAKYLGQFKITYTEV